MKRLRLRSTCCDDVAGDRPFRSATVAHFGRRSLLGVLLCATLSTAVLTTARHAPAADKETSGSDGKSDDQKKFRDFADVTKGAEKIEGLFTLYKKDDKVYADIKSSQFNQELLAPIAIARGMASAGTPLNFGDEWVLYFRRVGDRVQLVRKNVHYEAPEGTPVGTAVEQAYTDSVLMALPIESISPGGVLIDLGNIFFTDFAGLGIGSMDRSRTSWHKVKAFKNNVELEVESTFRFGGAGYSYYFGDDGVIDHRGITVVIHYSLAKRPSSGYRARYADQRIGHFISATKDYGSDDPYTNFRRRINRWRFEKADPQAKLSPPKRQLIWWVEETVPHEYRPYVEEGILEWNKAFEKIGYKNALGVRWQNERDEFDPEDINYCTFRWITTPYTFAMSGLRADPVTGEMIDGDVIFDASWIRYWRDEYATLVGLPVPSTSAETEPRVLDWGEVISPMMAVRYGFGQPHPIPDPRRARDHADHDLDGHPMELIPSTNGVAHLMLRNRLSPGKFTACQCSLAKRYEYQLAALALAARAGLSDDDKDGDDDDKDDDDKEKKEKKKAELPDEFIGQAIKEVVMHEVGHSLGLRHNFKASAMLSLDQINDKSITHEKGMVGSVMDYSPINISRKGEPQGDYATTTIGPYDYWAIEYAYKPISGSEKTELKKIAARSPEPDLLYATDEDLYSSNDPLVNAYDLGNDGLAYGKDRAALAAELLKQLDEKFIEDGESWAPLRSAFSVLLYQYGNAAYLATSYVGGQHFSRDFKGGENSRDPITPVSSAKQREALDFLVTSVLSDEAFKFSPQLLRRLTTDHWYHWGSDSMMLFGSTEYNVLDRILAIQKIALNQCLDASVLRRVQNQRLLRDTEENPFDVAEIYRKLTDGIWSETNVAEETKELSISTIRRNLQREHARKLCSIVVGRRRSPYDSLYSFVVFYGSYGSYPDDARDLARMHLKEIDGRITKVLGNDKLTIDDATRAHLQENHEVITKVLEARIEANEY